jgi:hypothetical protein
MINLQQSVHVMAQESNPYWPTKTLNKSKQNALKTLLDRLTFGRCPYFIPQMMKSGLTYVSHFGTL